VIGTDGTGSCKSNYNAIPTTTAPKILMLIVFFLNTTNNNNILSLVIQNKNIKTNISQDSCEVLVSNLK
jgi:hypothetical protein